MPAGGAPFPDVDSPAARDGEFDSMGDQMDSHSRAESTEDAASDTLPLSRTVSASRTVASEDRPQPDARKARNALNGTLPMMAKVELPEDPKTEAKEEDDDRMFSETDDDVPETPQVPRREFEEGVAVRKNAVHVYGLDFLQQDHMLEIFSQFNHRYIEWINDSSANVVFQDEAGATRALQALTFPKEGDPPWRRTPDIVVSDGLPPVFLQLRLAIATDAKPLKRNVPVTNLYYRPRPERRPRPRPTSGETVEEDKRRKVQAPTPEEAEKRRKRAERFGTVPVFSETPKTSAPSVCEPVDAEISADISKPDAETPEQAIVGVSS